MSARLIARPLVLTLVALGAIIFTHFPAETAAQSTIDLIFGNDLSLKLSPAHPAPRETVHAVAYSSFTDLSEVFLSWNVNGKKIAEGIGATEIDVQVGSAGDETRLTVAALEGGLPFASAEARIRPAELELIWESDSYVPPFYRGRALPSAGTNLRLEAIPRFVRAGSIIPASAIVFTWKRNGYVIQSASGRGKSIAIIESPGLYGTDTISVEAKTSDGTLESAASVRIAARSPRVSLYPAHPVFGIAYHQAFARTIPNIIEDAEASFSAVPYFTEATSRDDPSLSYEWSVNDIVIENDEETPSTITINAEGSSGEARVDLSLSHVTNLFFSTSDSWSFLFKSEIGETPFGVAQ